MLDCCRCWSASLTGVAVSARLAVVAVVAGSLPLLSNVSSPAPFVDPTLAAAAAVNPRYTAVSVSTRAVAAPSDSVVVVPPPPLLTPRVAVVPCLAAAAAAAVVRPCHAADAVPNPAADAAAACLPGLTTSVMAR